MTEPRSYRPRTDEATGTGAYSLTTRVLDYITKTARRENVSKSFVVNRAMEREMKSTTENEPAYDDRKAS